MKTLSETKQNLLTGGGFFSWIGNAIGYAIHSYCDNWGYSEASHYTRQI